MKTHEEHVRRVKLAHNGNITVISEYSKSTIKVKYKCCKKHVFKSSPSNVEVGHGCPICKGITTSKLCRKSSNDYANIVYAKFGVKILEPYITSHTPILHVCSKGHENKVKPNWLLSTKYGCITCSYELRSKKRSTTLYNAKEKLKNKHGERFKLLVYGGTIANKSKIKCCDCQFVWEVRLDALIRKEVGHGCPKCSIKFLKPDSYNLKDYILNKKLIKIQGYEPQALDLIIQNNLAKPSEIIAGDRDRIPIIEYIMNNKVKRYYPDIFIPKQNRIVEIKGTRTFGLWNEEIFCKNKVKAKTCINNGYKFSLLLMQDKNRLNLPKNWWNLSFTTVVKHIRKQL